MKSERTGWWRCSQLWILAVSALLCFAAALTFQRYAVGVSAYQGGPPIIDAPVKHLEHTHAPDPVDCSLVSCLALTFDDGPNPYTTPPIVDALEQVNGRATFFVEGKRVRGNEELLRRMYAAGFEIGNHSWDHPDLTKLSSSAVQEQINRTQMEVMRAGLPAPHLFRPPFGAINDSVRSQIPMTIASWNIDPRDWNTTDAQSIVNYVVAHAAPGSVVDLHDTNVPTARIIGPLVDALKDKYQLVTVSELFKLTGGQRGEFASRQPNLHKGMIK